MKKLTKVLSLVLALALVLMSVNIVAVNANDDVTRTIKINNNNSGHTYKAYRLFKGNGTGTTPSSDIRGDDTGNYLANIAFDDEVNTYTHDLYERLKKAPTKVTPPITDYDKTLGTAFTSKFPIEDDFKAEEFAKFLNEKVSTNSKAARYLGYILEEFFEGNNIKEKKASTDNTASSAGYVIADLPEGYYIVIDSKGEATDVESDYVLRLVGENVEITPKHQIPTVDKKVGTAEGGSSTQGTYNIGDEVPFIIKVTLPTNIGTYTNEYKLKITDKLTGFDTSESAAQTIKDSVKAYYDTNGDGIISSLDSNSANLIDHFTVTMDSATSTLTIEHKALEPGDSVDKHWKDHAGQNIIFSYSARLSGDALYPEDGNTSGGKNTVTLTYSNDPTVKDSINTTTPTPETVNVHSLELQVLKTDGESKPLNGADFTLSKLVGENFVALEDPTTVEKKTTNSDPSKNTVRDKFEFAGLGDGYYKLEETTVPNGYNKNDPIYLKIETTKNLANESLASVTVTQYAKWNETQHKPDDTDNGKKIVETPATSGSTLTDGVFTITVVNNSGVELPETGGMGTKIFYTLGGVLVVGAVILLVVKRRMRAE